LAVLASILAAGAVFVLTCGYLLRSAGVSMEDEYKEHRKTERTVGKANNVVLGCVLCAAVAYIVTGKLLFMVLALPGGILVARWFNERREKARKEVLSEQYVQVLSAMMASIQSGASPYQALENVVPSLPSPAQEIFIEILRRARPSENYNARYEEAVFSVAEETGWDELNSLGIALSLYSQTGLNLAEVFKFLVENAYETQGDRKYVESAISQIKMTSAIISALPFFILAFIHFYVPEFAEVLFNTTGGIVVILLAVGMIFIGHRIIGKMVGNVMEGIV